MDIYVSNLNNTINEADLKELFAGYGAITSIKIIKDHHTKESKGFGFISMPDESEALQAISSLHNFQIGHRALQVSKAKPRTSYRML